MRPHLVAFAACLALATLGTSARAVEPWSDPDPPAPPERTTLGTGDYGFRSAVEYRAAALYVNPISLNTTQNRNVSWMEHRLRLDGGLDWHDQVRVFVSADALDGVLWGDNGTYGQTPSPIAGANVSTKSPNVTRPCVAFRGGDPLTHDAYGYGLCSQEAITVRRAYGEVVLPFGLLRIGRQPTTIGNAIQGNDGDGRRNRFGFSRVGNSVDRILFGTKPLEAFKPAGRRNTSPNEGAFLFVAYSKLVQDAPNLFGDDLNEWVTGVRLLAPKWSGGTSAEIVAFDAFRWDRQYGTSLHTLGLRAMSRFGDWHAGLEAGANIGSTREVAAAYHAITNDPVVDQPVRQFGARAVVRYDKPAWTAYLEADFASGNEDPQARATLSQFTWAEDSHVGLIMFTHALGFQTARSSAAAVETLRRLEARSFPAEAINTRGAFTNALAIFPQVDLHPHKNVLVRGGVLVAWAPARVVDPVASLQARDGLTIEDDLVNYAGGKPGHFYGAELDGRVQWRWQEHFAFDLEGGILFPGDAFQDKNGQAVRSVLVQGRTTFFF